MTVTIATPDHQEKLIQFAREKTNVFKCDISTIKHEQYLSQLAEYLHNPNYKFVLVSEGDRLIGMTSIYLWQTLPYFTLGDLFIKRGPASTVTFRECLKALADRAIELATENERYVCYFISRMRPFSKKQYLELKHSQHTSDCIESFNRFQMSVEAIIPKNSRPQFQSYWKMMGESTHDCDLWVRRGTMEDRGYAYSP